MKAPRVWKSIAVATSMALAAAMIGALLTDLGPWYYALKQPPWKPSDLWFGPVWTTIFTLCAMSGVFGWWSTTDKKAQRNLLVLFAINFFFNALWSYLFFQAKRPDWAQMEVGFLWLSIVALIWFLWPLSRKASLLLVPYLLWVSFAARLNWAVIELNGPFNG